MATIKTILHLTDFPPRMPRSASSRPRSAGRAGTREQGAKYAAVEYVHSVVRGKHTIAGRVARIPSGHARSADD